MSERAQKYLIFILMIAIIAIMLIWFYALNYGSLTINTGLTNYTLYINNKPTLCVQDPCELKLNVGNHEIIFEKDEYGTITTETYISRGEIDSITLEPKKIIKLNPSSFTQKEEKPSLPVTTQFDSETIVASVWNTTKDKYLFLDKEDGRLKVADINGETKSITILKNIGDLIDFFWSPDENRVLISKNKDIYFIEIEQGSRHKYILDFMPVYILWSPNNNYFLLNDKDYFLYKIYWDDKENVQPMDLKLNLIQSEWIDENSLIYYTIDNEKNKTDILIFNIQTKAEEHLLQKFDFPINDIYYDAVTNIAYFYNSREKVWYETEI